MAYTIPALSVLEVFPFDPLLYKDRPKVLSRIRFSELLSWLAWWRCAYSIGALQQEGLGFKYTTFRFGFSLSILAFSHSLVRFNWLS